MLCVVPMALGMIISCNADNYKNHSHLWCVAFLRHSYISENWGGGTGGFNKDSPSVFGGGQFSPTE